MKILIIQNKMGIGDMIIYLPFIEAISKKFNTPVSILVKESSKAAQFLKDSKIINKIIILERDNKLIFSLIDISCACPVLPNIATP